MAERINPSKMYNRETFLAKCGFVPQKNTSSRWGTFDTIRLDERIADRLLGYDEGRLGELAHEADWSSKSLEYPCRCIGSPQRDGSKSTAGRPRRSY
jgi:hypothetical protein